MNVDGKNIDDSQRMRLLAEIEHEGDRSPIQVDPLEQTMAIEDVERLCAADLVLTMRRIREKSQGWSEITREQFAKRYELLSAEAAAAAVYLRRFRASDELPDFLRANGAA